MIALSSSVSKKRRKPPPGSSFPTMLPRSPIRVKSCLSAPARSRRQCLAIFRAAGVTSCARKDEMNSARQEVVHMIVNLPYSSSPETRSGWSSFSGCSAPSATPHAAIDGTGICRDPQERGKPQELNTKVLTKPHRLGMKRTESINRRQ